MKILIVTNNPHLPQQYGGSEVSIEELSLSLLEEGENVRVLSGINANGSLYYFNRLKSLLIRKKFPSDRKQGYTVYRGWNQNGTVIEGFKEVTKSFIPELLIVQGSNVLQLTTELCMFDIPMIVSFIDVEAPNLVGTLPTRNNITYLANSTFTANKIFDKLGIKCEVIPPLVRTQKYFTNTSREVVTFINPHPFKGSELAIALARKNPLIPFIFQESWPLGKKYKTWLKTTLSEIHNIQYREPTMDMKSLYAITKILLVPSQYEEAWGRVVNEAQISGIPVIASNRGGLPEAVGTGGIVLSYDASLPDWNTALNELWCNIDVYNTYSQKAFARMKTGDLSRNHLIGKYISAFNGIKSNMQAGLTARQ